MNPSIKILLNRIAVLVVVTLAVAAVFDWTIYRAMEPARASVYEQT